MQLNDTHCHLNFHAFEEDFDDILTRSLEQGINRIMIPGTNLEDCESAIQLSQLHSECYAAVGIHPNDPNEWNETTACRIEKLAHKTAVFAIGEIGLDYYRDHAPQDLQKVALLAQLTIAKEVQKPTIIHIRESMQDSFDFLFDWQTQLAAENHPLAARPGILHAFPGTIEDARQAIQHHFKIGVGGPVTFKNAKDRHAVVSQLPLSAIVLETDAPFLAPHPHRGQRNEPAYIRLIAEQVAQLKGIPVEAVAEQTTQNANEVFQWNSAS